MKTVTKIAEPVVDLIWEALFMVPVQIVIFLAAALADNSH